MRCVVLTAAASAMFCSGANIYMLGQSTHGWKVNFCKFTNETRNGMEDSSRHDGLKFLAAVNGACAGGGYEVALACDEILMIDDRSSAVSLPEVPLLGVLPGTGGLTRVTDKRKVRRDLADVFCTTAEGVRAERAKDWGLVDDSAKPQAFADSGEGSARCGSPRRATGRPQAKGVALTPLKRTIDEGGYHYDTSTWPSTAQRAAPRSPSPRPRPRRRPPTRRHPRRRRRLVAAADGARTRRRHPDAAHQRARNRHLAAEDPRRRRQRAGRRRDARAPRAAHWFVRETIGMLRRTLARLDVTSRTLFAIIEPGSCFAGTLAELALAADRSYMLRCPTAAEDGRAPRIALSEFNSAPIRW